tara:strand:- start:2500 stop:2802 length:303 start_codon:yes stop_codon:yes gene_type:complete
MTTRAFVVFDSVLYSEFTAKISFSNILGVTKAKGTLIVVDTFKNGTFALGMWYTCTLFAQFLTNIQDLVKRGIFCTAQFNSLSVISVIVGERLLCGVNFN